MRHRPENGAVPAGTGHTRITENPINLKTNSIMKKIISGLTAGCVFAALLFTGCSDSDDGDSGVVTKPVVKFETASDANLVKAVITSDIDLKSVVVSTSWGTGADAHSETVATITSFDNPKSYTYENRFTVPSGYLEMIVSVKAENTRNLSTTVTTKLQGEIAITMTDVINAMSAAFREWESTGAMPESVSIQGFPFPKAQYFEYAARTFFNLYTGKTDNPVVVGTYLDAEDNERPDTFEQDEISKNMLNDALTKMINYAASNGMYPNYASYGTVAIAPYEDPDGVAYEGLFHLPPCGGVRRPHARLLQDPQCAGQHLLGVPDHPGLCARPGRNLHEDGPRRCAVRRLCTVGIRRDDARDHYRQYLFAR